MTHAATRRSARSRAISLMTTCALTVAFGPAASAEAEVTLNDFYRPFTLSEITPKNMQSWPYYKYVSTHWEEYGLFGTVPVMASKTPAAGLETWRSDRAPQGCHRSQNAKRARRGPHL
jgi:hypothetical protein